MYSENASIHGPHSRAFALWSSPSAYSPAQYSDRSRDEHSCLFLTAVSPCASASCHMYTVPATRNSPVCYNDPEPRCTWYTYSPFSRFPNQALPLAKTSRTHCTRPYHFRTPPAFFMSVHFHVLPGQFYNRSLVCCSEFHAILLCLVVLISFTSKQRQLVKIVGTLLT